MLLESSLEADQSSKLQLLIQASPKFKGIWKLDSDLSDLKDWA